MRKLNRLRVQPVSVELKLYVITVCINGKQYTRSSAGISLSHALERIVLFIDGKSIYPQLNNYVTHKELTVYEINQHFKNAIN